MLHGDISNRVAPFIAFNIDNLLFKEETNKSFIKNLIKFFTSDKQRFFNRDINEDFLRKLNYIWNKYFLSIALISFYPRYEKEYNKFLEKYNVPFSSLIFIHEWEELRRRCHSDFIYYFDNNEELISYISSPNAYHIDYLFKILK